MRATARCPCARMRPMRFIQDLFPCCFQLCRKRGTVAHTEPNSETDKGSLHACTVCLPLRGVRPRSPKGMTSPFDSDAATAGKRWSAGGHFDADGVPHELVDEDEHAAGSMHTWCAHGMLALQETLIGAAIAFQLMFVLGGPVSRYGAPAAWQWVLYVVVARLMFGSLYMLVPQAP
jgi:hypothetical protein